MALTCPNCMTRFKVKAAALGAEGRKVKCAKCDHRWFATQGDLDLSGAPSQNTVPKPAKKKRKKKGAQKPAPAPAPAPAPTTDIDADAPPPPPPPPPPPSEMDKVMGAMSALASSVDEKEAANNGPNGDSDAGATPDVGEPDAPPPPPPPPMEEPPFPEPPIGRNEKITPRQRRRRTQKKSPLGAWIFLAFLVLGTAIGGFFFRFDIVKMYRPANAVFAAIGFPVDTLGFGLTIEKPRTKAIINPDERILEVTGGITNTTADSIEVPLLRGALMNAQNVEVYVWTFTTDEATVLPGETVDYTTQINNPPRGATNLFVTFTRPEEMMEDDEEMQEDTPVSDDSAS